MSFGTNSVSATGSIAENNLATFNPSENANRNVTRAIGEPSASTIVQDAKIFQLLGDLFVRIWQDLDMQSIGRCSSVCKRWEVLIKSNNALWEKIFVCHFPNQDTKEIKDFQLAYKKGFLNLKGTYYMRALEAEHKRPSSFAVVDGLILFSCASRTITMRDPKSQKQDTFLQCDAQVVAIGAVDKTETLLCGCLDGSVEVWHIPSSKRLGILPSLKLGVRLSSFLNISNAVFVGYEDGTIGVGDATFCEWLMTLQDDSEGVFSLAYAQEGRGLLSGSRAGVKVWDLNPPVKCIASPPRDNGGISSLAVNENRIVFCGCFNGAIEIWEAADSKDPIIIPKAHDAPVSCLFVDDEKGVLFSSCEGGDPEDRGIKIWDLKSYKYITTLYNDDDYCAGSFIGVDGMLITAFSGKTVESGNTIVQFSFTTEQSLDEMEEVSEQSESDLDED
jgi:hypothetical protein